MAIFAIALPGVLIFSSLHLAEEREPIEQMGEQVAGSINAALAASPGRQAAIIESFATSLPDIAGNVMRFHPVGSEAAPGQRPWVPAWFSNLLRPAQSETLFPILSEGKLIGHLAINSYTFADLVEKWIAFAAITILGSFLLLMNFITARLVLGGIVRPLQELGNGLEQLQAAKYDIRVQSVGPPEIRKSFDQLNSLARTLRTLTEDNRTLIQRMIGLQDKERNQISQELHDELGPLLFALRANASALATSADEDPQTAKERAQNIVGVVEQLQTANHRILDRMRPMPVDTVGLTRSIESLFRSAAFKGSKLKFDVTLDPQIDDLDENTAMVIYRLVQEALTNVLRHAKAANVRLWVFPGDPEQGEDTVVEIADDGAGAPTGFSFGRGLTGMQERVRALGGTFTFETGEGGTTITARLPAVHPEHDTAFR